ncbi:MAG TPA: hypothetical protein VJM33_10065 [Microthrixaceae bacterium]|nr:hypothetical protein [Microthrixaceae bacterium]
MKLRYWMLSLPVVIMTVVSCTTEREAQNAWLAVEGIAFLLAAIFTFSYPGGVGGLCLALPFCTST